MLIIGRLVRVEFCEDSFTEDVYPTRKINNNLGILISVEPARNRRGALIFVWNVLTAGSMHRVSEEDLREVYVK